ncbi:hypothetical protein Talka_02048 [Tepidimonas alkaliphilus]|uniref:Uncharacterized protein n=1 Tax=Tepidimonas alkaliphilus TaxID=2588942 RepID=A0A554W4Q5_9BURK|nr:prepilin-type N-terminal cleavage/methylation domain-containing protein [Tepidimonas alkaliphilus]TSE18551.1 hypothetical protein Talka_02048 [Tepidimonas alkaliphilus]
MASLMLPQSFLPRRQRGFSLPELAVALTISSLILLGLVGYFLAQRQTSQVTTRLAEQQESLRVAYELLARDIREARYLPCGGAGNAQLVNGTLLQRVWQTPLEVLARPDSNFPAPSLPTPFEAYDTNGSAAIRRVKDTDAIVVRYARTDSIVSATRSGNVLTLDLSATPYNLAKLNLPKVGDSVVVCNFWNTVQTTVTAVGSGTLTVADLGNLNSQIDRVRIAKLEERLWFLGTTPENLGTTNCSDGKGKCSLYSVVAGQSAQEYVSGVEAIKLSRWCHQNGDLVLCPPNDNTNLTAVRFDALDILKPVSGAREAPSTTAAPPAVKLTSQPMIAVRNPL